jgi:hypothetical protein
VRSLRVLEKVGMRMLVREGIHVHDVLSWDVEKVRDKIKDEIVDYLTMPHCA